MRKMLIISEPETDGMFLRYTADWLPNIPDMKHPQIKGE